MELKKQKKRRAWLWVAFFAPTLAAAGILGTGPGPEILIPYLTEQIGVMKNALHTANDTLGAVKGVQRGIDRIRHYTLGDWMDENVWSENEVSGVRREWRTLQRGGSSASAGMQRLRKELYRTSSDDSEYRQIDQEGMRFRHVNVDEEVLDVGDRTVLQQEERIREYHDTGSAVYENASESESMGEASKISAEAQGILIRQQSDSLRLQSHQIRVAQAQLAHESTKEREAITSHLVESAKLANAFLELKPFR